MSRQSIRRQYQRDTRKQLAHKANMAEERAAQDREHTDKVKEVNGYLIDRCKQAEARLLVLSVALTKYPGWFVRLLFGKQVWQIAKQGIRQPVLGAE